MNGKHMTSAETIIVTTHFADNVLMEPVVSISPARNSWYFVQAMLDVRTGHKHQAKTTTKKRFLFSETQVVVHAPSFL